MFMMYCATYSHNCCIPSVWQTKKSDARKRLSDSKKLKDATPEQWSSLPKINDRNSLVSSLLDQRFAQRPVSHCLINVLMFVCAVLAGRVEGSHSK